MTLDSVIKAAILNKEIVEFTYHRHNRICEPHVYGVKNGKYQVLFYQIGGGSSSGGIPEWRRMDVGEISGLRTTGNTFPGPRPYPSGQHSDWDTIIALVK